jgi:general secretion pathway protein H
MPVISATGNHGFTLLELLAVLAIMVLLAGAWPFAAQRLFPKQQLRSEGQILMGALRIARMSARVKGVPQTLEFNDAGDGYEAGAEQHTLPAGIIAHIRNGEPSIRPVSVRFFPDGSSSGGVIDLALPHRTLSVRVGKVTGRAELVE